MAAGNEDEGHESFWPASYPDVLAVGAHDEFGNRADFGGGSKSNFQPYVRISAPGINVYTTDMVGYTANGYYRGFLDPADVPYEYSGRQGTTYASPVVAGIAAIVLGNEPSLTPTQLRTRLISTNKDMANPYDWGNAGEIGAVDAYAAVTGGH